MALLAKTMSDFYFIFVKDNDWHIAYKHWTAYCFDIQAFSLQCVRRQKDESSKTISNVALQKQIQNCLRVVKRSACVWYCVSVIHYWSCYVFEWYYEFQIGLTFQTSIHIENAPLTHFFSNHQLPNPLFTIARIHVFCLWLALFNYWSQMSILIGRNHSLHI